LKPVYATDDPVNGTDPDGKTTLGACAGASLTLGFIQFQAGDCLVKVINGPNAGQIGLTGTPALAAGIGVQAGIRWVYQVSTADSLQALGGWFQVAGGTAEFFGGITASVFWGEKSNKTTLTVVGADAGIEIGAGFSVSYGLSYTFVHTFGGIPADFARAAWDLVVPGGLLITTWLNDAVRESTSHGGPNLPCQT